MAVITPTYEQFTTRFPQFAGADYVVLGPICLEASIGLLDKSVWDDQFALGVMLDCAHNLSLASVASQGGTGGIQMASGPISSTSVAGVSTSFNSASPDGKSANKDFYSKTVYGQQFLRLQANVCYMAVI